MKYIFASLLVIHGSIHLFGFAKGLSLAPVELLASDVAKIAGVFWLITFLLFIATAIVFMAKADWWYIIAFVAILISTILIITVWSEAKYGTIPNIIILFAVFIGYATANFSGLYKKEVKDALVQTEEISESVLTEEDMLDLPDQVRKYLRYTGALGKPKVKNFKIEFDGKIRKNEQSPWMPFHSEQYNILKSATRLFFMKAVMKGFPVAGFHCYKNGDAFMDIRLLSVIKVQFQSGSEMSIAETVTFFNDMCVMAPATLIDKRIKWSVGKENNVKAEFTNNNITISAWLYFNEKGELINFVSEDRYAAGGNKTLDRLPWLTPMKDYRIVDGFRHPTYAETIIKYPEGDLCYGIFMLKQVKYNCKEQE